MERFVTVNRAQRQILNISALTTVRDDSTLAGRNNSHQTLSTESCHEEKHYKGELWFENICIVKTICIKNLEERHWWMIRMYWICRMEVWFGHMVLKSAFSVIIVDVRTTPSVINVWHCLGKHMNHTTNSVTRPSAITCTCWAVSLIWGKNNFHGLRYVFLHSVQKKKNVPIIYSSSWHF